MPSKWGEAIPHIERVDGFDIWVINGDAVRQAGQHGDGRLRRHAARRAGDLPGHAPARAWDPKARIEFMDEQHIRAQVLYPNLGGFGAGAWLDKGDPGYALDCVRAYNDFQTDFRHRRPTGCCRSRRCRSGTSTPRSPRSSAAPPTATAA